jgi:hypothetical protein
VAAAREHESNFVAGLLDTVRERGFAAETCTLDKGYDNGRVYRECADRQCVPIIPLRETPDVQRVDHKPPTCEHGQWRFAGADAKRGASKWRCRPATASPRQCGSRLTGCTR